MLISAISLVNHEWQTMSYVTSECMSLSHLVVRNVDDLESRQVRECFLIGMSVWPKKQYTVACVY